MPKQKKSKKKTFSWDDINTWPEGITNRGIEDSCLTMEARQLLEQKIVESCATKATLEKNAAKPLHHQLNKNDKQRCWYAAYSASLRWVLKNI